MLVSPRAAEASGFMLVGVVMFVFVLTILGLSLFGLSGFESEFLYASSRRAESFYLASTGVERTRFVLGSNRPMSEVKNNLPTGVLYAVAKQGPDFATADSTGVVSWGTSAADIWIRVVADVRGERTMVQQRFRPAIGDTFIYKRLFTISGPESLEVRQYDFGTSSPNRWPQAYLNGRVRTPYVVPGAFNRGGTNPPNFWSEQVGSSEAPDLTSYWTAFWGAASSAPTPDPSEKDFSFVGSYAGGTPGNPRFFKTTGVMGNGWTMDVDDDYPGHCDIDVSGTVVWMIESGILFREQVHIRGENNPLLVIVAGFRSPLLPQEPRTGISFKGGLHEPDGSRRCPVILVSNGRVNLEADNDSNNEDTDLTYLSVFARNALVMGPATIGSNEMVLSHSTSSAHDLPGGVVYEMVRQGKLPNTQGSILNRLQPIAGTWTETP